MPLIVMRSDPSFPPTASSPTSSPRRRPGFLPPPILVATVVTFEISRPTQPVALAKARARSAVVRGVRNGSINHPSSDRITARTLAFARVTIGEARKIRRSASHNPGMKPCVYILTSRRGGFLYIGVTADIHRRLQQHLDGQVQHTRKYRIRRLVYLEPHQRITDAIQREKQLKFWKRAWKIRLIEEANPRWNDLADIWPGSIGFEQSPTIVPPTQPVALAEARARSAGIRGDIHVNRIDDPSLLARPRHKPWPTPGRRLGGRFRGAVRMPKQPRYSPIIPSNNRATASAPGSLFPLRLASGT